MCVVWFERFLNVLDSCCGNTRSNHRLLDELNIVEFCFVVK